MGALPGGTQTSFLSNEGVRTMKFSNLKICTRAWQSFGLTILIIADIERLTTGTDMALAMVR